MKPPIKQQSESNPMRFVICAFFLTGMISACIISHIFKTSLYAPVLNFYQSMLSHLGTMEIDAGALLLLVCKKHLKYFLLLWFFSLTNIWNYYYRLFLAYIGFQNGLLLSFCLFMNGPLGILEYLCFLLPHALFLVPGYFISIYRGQLIYRQLQKDGSCIKKSQLILHQIPSFLVAISFLLIACLMESYLNPHLLRLFFKL